MHPLIQVALTLLGMVAMQCAIGYFYIKSQEHPSA
jgi:hypothetical protein